MRFQAFGSDRRETIVLLHGGGLGWWNYCDEARLLQSDYHVILPILDGHAGSDRPFTTIEDNATELIEFIDDQLGGSALLIGGLSLGGQVLLEMLARRGDLCRFALIESAAVVPSRLTRALVGPAFGLSYGLIKNRRFAKLQFQSLHIREALFEDYYRDTRAIAKSDMIAFMKASVSYSLKESIRGCRAQTHIFFGERENREILRSAKTIHEALPDSGITALAGLYHGEFSLNRAEDYVKAIRSILNGQS